MKTVAYREWVATCLARAALAGPGTHEAALRERFEATLGTAAPWIGALAERLARHAQGGWSRLDAAALVPLVLQGDDFALGFAEGAVPRVRRLILRPLRMKPAVFALDSLVLPALPATGDLARWLGHDLERLQWLTSPAQAWRVDSRRGLAGPSHYHRRWRPKAAGGLRLIEVPKGELKAAQRRLLDGLLVHVPVHEACAGFAPGRSAPAHAALHAGQAVVLRLDLRDFFASITAARVRAVFATLGYPAGTAAALAALATTRVPRSELDRLCREGRLDPAAARRLSASHLPQGAPCSPALANLCAFGLDLRLDGLAWTFGARYSRYADDLTFSGPAALRARVGALRAWAQAICLDEGFQPHPGKTRVMPAHRRQVVTGIVVNQRPNPVRVDFDRLKAVLHRCVLHGPDAENRERHPDFKAHLQGRIAWVAQLNPARGARLQALFERVQWPHGAGPVPRP